MNIFSSILNIFDDAICVLNSVHICAGSVTVINDPVNKVLRDIILLYDIVIKVIALHSLAADRLRLRIHQGIIFVSRSLMEVCWA